MPLLSGNVLGNLVHIFDQSRCEEHLDVLSELLDLKRLCSNRCYALSQSCNFRRASLIDMRFMLLSSINDTRMEILYVNCLEYILMQFTLFEFQSSSIARKGLQSSQSLSFLYLTKVCLFDRIAPLCILI